MRSFGRPALIRYALIWIVAGGMAAVLGLVLIDALRDEHERRADPIAAVARSGCVLERPRGLQRHHSRPPVDGPAADPAAVGIHARPPARARLVGALRRGLVVVQYTPGAPATATQALTSALRRSEAPLILTPDRSGMPFMVAATAWHRLLGCSRIDARVVGALRAFTTRYAGSGPDA